jgi:hypothetical protein
MMLAIIIIFAIVFILALLYPLGCLLEKHMQSRQKKYQEHIDSMVEELFPPSIPAAIQDSSAIDTTVQEAAVIESYDPQYQEAKRKMVADIRTYFNQRKINAAIAKIPGPDELAPVNPSAGSYGDRGSYEELTFPTPPSIERLME